METERERADELHLGFVGSDCHKLPGVPLEPLAEGDRDEDDELKRNDGAEFFFLASKQAQSDDAVQHID